MKKPNALLKLAAVVSSVLLVGGLVSYRAGAFNWPMETNSPPADSESSPTPEEPDPTFISGSKLPYYVIKPNRHSASPPSASQPPERPK